MHSEMPMTMVFIISRTVKKKMYYIYALISNVSIILLSRPSTQFYLFIDVAFLLY